MTANQTPWKPTVERFRQMSLRLPEDERPAYMARVRDLLAAWPDSEPEALEWFRYAANGGRHDEAP